MRFFYKMRGTKRRSFITKKYHVLFIKTGFNLCIKIVLRNIPRNDFENYFEYNIDLYE